jgi:hypothetical protein
MKFPIAVLLLCAQAATALADCAPEKLVRMVTKEVSPGTPADSFAATPRVTYRLGNGRVRTEEQVNPATGEHGLTVINAPDAWVIDLTAKTGEHSVDPDRPSKVRAPVFAETDLPPEITALEMGCELEFIATATAHDRVETQSGAGMKHSVRSGNWKLTLVVKENETVPMAAILSRDEKVYRAISYLSYRIIEPVPAALFAPPAGIVFKKL